MHVEQLVHAVDLTGLPISLAQLHVGEIKIVQRQVTLFRAQAPFLPGLRFRFLGGVCRSVRASGFRPGFRRRRFGKVAFLGDQQRAHRETGNNQQQNGSGDGERDSIADREFRSRYSLDGGLASTDSSFR